MADEKLEWGEFQKEIQKRRNEALTSINKVSSYQKIELQYSDISDKYKDAKKFLKVDKVESAVNSYNYALELAKDGSKLKDMIKKLLSGNNAEDPCKGINAAMSVELNRLSERKKPMQEKTAFGNAKLIELEKELSGNSNLDKKYKSELKSTISKLKKELKETETELKNLKTNAKDFKAQALVSLGVLTPKSIKNAVEGSKPKVGCIGTLVEAKKILDDMVKDLSQGVLDSKYISKEANEILTLLSEGEKSFGYNYYKLKTALEADLHVQDQGITDDMISQTSAKAEEVAKSIVQVRKDYITKVEDESGFLSALKNLITSKIKIKNEIKEKITKAFSFIDGLTNADDQRSILKLFLRIKVESEVFGALSAAGTGGGGWFLTQSRGELIGILIVMIIVMIAGIIMAVFSGGSTALLAIGIGIAVLSAGFGAMTAGDLAMGRYTSSSAYQLLSGKKRK